MKKITNIISGIILGIMIMVTCIACDNIEKTEFVEETFSTETYATESNTSTTTTTTDVTTETTTTDEVIVTEDLPKVSKKVSVKNEVNTKKKAIASSVKTSSSPSKVNSKKSNREIANEVIRGDWGNGIDRKNRLTKAGYSYKDVQTIVNDILKSDKVVKNDTNPTKTVKTAITKTKKTGSKPTTTAVSKENVTTETVIDNNVTTSTEAVDETTETTTVETTVEAAVETTETTDSVKKSDEEIADEVINGLWDNNENRKRKLTEAGYDCAAIQKIVNEKVKKINSQKTSQSSGTTDSVSGTAYCGSFKGTYYAYGGARRGGSGRQLIDCSCGDGTVKGSIASRYFYSNYGYNYNGKRTMVYLEVAGYPQMNGYYYVDDCCGSYSVIDFFYIYNSNCPFQYAGVTGVSASIVNY